MYNLFKASALALTIVLTGCQASQEHSASPSNLFADLLGKSQLETDAKVEAAFQQIFYGDDENERIYYPTGENMAYIWDVGSDDVRSEGMSYGMMIAVQLNKKEEFDRLWNWTFTHMQVKEGRFKGYFNWHNKTSGEMLDEGPASDGEEWFVMALFFASNLWGDGEGVFNYRAHANDILDAMLHLPSDGVKTLPIFDSEYHMVRFVPWMDWDGVTDASYHLPAFYELWAKWADSDKAFWAKAAETSRAFFKTAAHPETGLMPDYSYYKPTEREIGDHADFRFDAWRIIPNVALDHAWWGKDEQWQTMQSDRILAFLGKHLPNVPNQFSVEGKPLDTQSSPGLFAMAATAGLAASRENATPFVQRLWDQPVPSGHWRYYDGVIHMLGLLQTSGHFRIIE